MKHSRRLAVLLGLVLGILLFCASAGWLDNTRASAQIREGTNPPSPTPPAAGDMPPLEAGTIISTPIFIESPAPIVAAQVGAAPAINIWYGAQQSFGQLGNPQQWVNILGNVSDPAGVASLVYALNQGALQALSLGADDHRLAQAGDFNIELDTAALRPGANEVSITATNQLGQQTTTVVTVNYQAGQTWPLPYTANWASTTNLQNLAQAVDGQWAIQNSVLRPLVFDYDRLVAIGDDSWVDYEVTVPVTIHGIDASGYSGPSNGPGVGLIMRWSGHYQQSNEQPRLGWQHLGALAWFRWTRVSGVYSAGMHMIGYSNKKMATRPDRVPALNTPYIFKMRVESVADQGDMYSFKVWQTDQPEPAAWDMVAQGHDLEPQSGSLVLVAHHVDASFGAVSVRPLTAAAPTSITIVLDSQPDHKRNVLFGGDLGSFKLDDISPDDGDAFGAQRVFAVQPGAFSINQVTSNSGWSVGDIQCTSSAGTVNLSQRTVTITASPGAATLCRFVYNKPATVRARVYDDRNDNGSRNSGEPWQNAWPVTLYTSDGAVVKTLLTNKYGKANFNLLAPNDYTLCTEVRDGWRPTLPPLDPARGQACASFTLAAGKVAEVRFGHTTKLAANAPPVTGENPVRIYNAPDDGAEEDDNATFTDTDIDTPVLDEVIFLPLVQP